MTKRNAPLRSCLTLTVALLAGLAFWPVPPTLAQASKLDDGPPPPPGAAPASADVPPLPPEPVPIVPKFDPVRAHKDMEIGAYELKTGNYKAAVDRLQEAAKLQPGLAEPFRLLGRTYEKMHDAKNAMDSYRKYLETYPTAPDEESVRKQIERLADEIQSHAAK